MKRSVPPHEGPGWTDTENPWDDLILMAMALLLVLFAVSVLLLSGCATTHNQVRPAGCEDSFIYDHIPNPAVVSAVEILAVKIAAEHSPPFRSILTRFAEVAEQVLQDDKLTYLELGKLILDQTSYANSYVGTTALAASEIFAEFDRAVPLTGCDRRFLTGHFQRQLKVLQGHG